MIPLYKCNPFIRFALVQDAVMEGDRPRIPYDNRIFFIYEGVGIMILNGKEIEIGANTLIYLGITDNYYFRGKFRAAVFNFDMTMNFCERKNPICPVPIGEYDEGCVFDKTEVEGFISPIVFSADEMLKNEITLLTDTYIKGGPWYESTCSAMLKKLLADILTAKNEMRDSKELLAARVLDYIKNNAPIIHDNKLLAERFGYHHIYLGEIFKLQTGKTLHAAITEEKLRIASRMLIYTNNSVEEIAGASGFSSRNQFCTVFKRYFGTSPLSYRKKRIVNSI